MWVERIPYEETRLYTKRVIMSMAAYEFLYARDLPAEALRTPLAASAVAAANAMNPNPAPLPPPPAGDEGPSAAAPSTPTASAPAAD